MEVFITYNDDNVKSRINKEDYKSSSFCFIDERTLKGKKQGQKIRGHFAAHKLPFIGVYQDGKAIKGFYSEAEPDVIDSLIKFLNQ